MKKILGSIMTIALVAVVAIGATRAYFTDQETNTGNTFTTGTLDILIDGKDYTGKQISSPFFDVTGMVPGDKKTAYVEIKNNGTIDVRFRSYISETTNTTVESDKFSDQLMVTITLNPSGYSKVSDGSLYGPTDFAIYGSGPLSGLLGVANARNNHAPADPLAPNYVAVYKVEVELPSSTTSTWEGASFVGDIVVDATQADNQTDDTNPDYGI